MSKKAKKILKIILVTLICICYLVLTVMAGAYVSKRITPQIYNYSPEQVEKEISEDPQVLKSFEGDGYTVYLCEDQTIKVTGMSPYNTAKRLYLEAQGEKAYVHTQKPLIYDVIEVNYEEQSVVLESGKVGLFHDVTWGDAAFFLMLIVGVGLFNNLVLVDRVRQEKGEFE
ncbi:MAG: hypothetical protein IJ744_05575 [Lachnospiraceae bacterium]|nr:hypothetical protein [Lachnospiraceae bacterium]